MVDNILSLQEKKFIDSFIRVECEFFFTNNSVLKVHIFLI